MYHTPRVNGCGGVLSLKKVHIITGTHREAVGLWAGELGLLTSPVACSTCSGRWRDLILVTLGRDGEKNKIQPSNPSPSDPKASRKRGDQK